MGREVARRDLITRHSEHTSRLISDALRARETLKRRERLAAERLDEFELLAARSRERADDELGALELFLEPALQWIGEREHLRLPCRFPSPLKLGADALFEELMDGAELGPCRRRLFVGAQFFIEGGIGDLRLKALLHALELELGVRDDGAFGPRAPLAFKLRLLLLLTILRDRREDRDGDPEEEPEVLLHKSDQLIHRLASRAPSMSGRAYHQRALSAL